MMITTTNIIKAPNTPPNIAPRLLSLSFVDGLPNIKDALYDHNYIINLSVLREKLINAKVLTTDVTASKCPSLSEITKRLKGKYP